MRKFRLFNPSGKKKYIFKMNSPNSTPQANYKARKSKHQHDVYTNEPVASIYEKFCSFLKISCAK